MEAADRNRQFSGRARVLEGEELKQAVELFKKEFGVTGNLLRRASYRLLRGEPMSTYVLIRLLPDDSPV